ncbi:MAG: flagellar hook-associated protein 3 [Pelosinus sp.]|jgi:flagellar hook-associated protein 3|nr:flagellar hook-associated protein 3 [Pelosinus sp.]
MRITNNMMSNNYLGALNKSLERQSKIQEQLSDGKAIHRPSDDPIKTIRSLRFNTNLAMNDQFTQHVSDSLSWMETTDAAMSDLSTIMIRIKELTVSADDTKPADALEAIGQEIDQLINQAVQIGNTKIGDRYVFAGQMDDTKPFERKQIKDPNSNLVKDVVVYNGDMNKISMLIKPGVANPSEDSINLTGDEVFGPISYIYGQPTMDIFSNLINLKQELVKTSSTNKTSGAVGDATIGGTYTGTGYTNYAVRIDGVAAGQVTGASYSEDGGNTWIAAATTAGNPSNVTLSNGVVLDIVANAGNAVNGTYSFHVPNNGVNGTDTTWVSNVGLGNVDAGHNAQLKKHTEVGARMATYEMAKNMMESNNVTISSDISANEDLDIAAAIIDQKTSENVYKAALAVGARILPPSLVDFLS